MYKLFFMCGAEILLVLMQNFIFLYFFLQNVILKFDMISYKLLYNITMDYKNFQF